MKSLKIKSFAKINLALDVLKKDKSGFHEIQTVYYEVKNLHDIIELKKDKNAVRIKIKKNIPVSSGLGGGSSNTVAITKGLNKFWNLKISKKKMLESVTKEGMDMPFFMDGGVALGTHFGEKIKQLKPIKGLKITINKKSSKLKNKTEKMYKKLTLKLCGKNLDKTKKLLYGIRTGNKKMITENIHNDFEQLYKMKKGEHLSGSGPSTFTVK